MNVEDYKKKKYITALYLRLSKDDGDKEESESISNQRKILRAFAEENKIIVYDEYVDDAKIMATVYTAIAAFENTVRHFVVKVLLENVGENWWESCVSEKIRKLAESRKREEEKKRRLNGILSVENL